MQIPGEAGDLLVLDDLLSHVLFLHIVGTHTRAADLPERPACVPFVFCPVYQTLPALYRKISPAACVAACVKVCKIQKGFQIYARFSADRHGLGQFFCVCRPLSCKNLSCPPIFTAYSPKNAAQNRRSFSFYTVARQVRGGKGKDYFLWKKPCMNQQVSPKHARFAKGTSRKRKTLHLYIRRECAVLAVNRDRTAKGGAARNKECCQFL